MSSVDDIIKEAFRPTEEIKLPNGLTPELPCIENLENPLFATQRGITSFGTSVKIHKQNLEEDKKAEDSSFTIESPRKDLSFELKLLGEIVSSTEEYQSKKVTKEQHIKRIIDFLTWRKRGKETIALYTLEKLQHLRNSGYLDGSFSLITYNVGEIEELLAELITLDDYNNFYRTVKELEYTTIKQLLYFNLKNRGFTKEKLYFIGRELASRGYVVHIPSPVEKREVKRPEGGEFYVVRTGILSFMDQFANEFEDTFIDLNADTNNLTNLKIPMCRYILSVLNEGKVKVPEWELEYPADNVGVIMRPIGKIIRKGGSVPEYFQFRYLEYMLNLLVTQQINMELKKEERSYVSKFEKLEANNRYKKPLYQFSISYISNVLQKLRVAKQCFPYIPFVNANEVEKMWPKFSGVDTEQIISDKESMKKLRPVTYMIFITAIQKHEKGFGYTEPRLDEIRKFSISEYGKKNLGPVTPLIPYVELHMPYNIFGIVRTAEDIRENIRKAIQNRQKPRF